MLNIAELSKIKVDDLSKFISSKISSLDHQILLLEYKSKNNLSFGIFENKNLIAVCPVSYEKKENYNIGTFFNISLPFSSRINVRTMPMMPLVSCPLAFASFINTSIG